LSRVALEAEHGADRPAREAEGPPIEADPDGVAGLVGIDRAEVAIVGPDAEVIRREPVDAEADAVAQVVVLDLWALLRAYSGVSCALVVGSSED